MRKPLGSHKNDEQVIDISPVVDEVVELANVTDLSRFAFDTDHEIPPKTPLQSPTEQISQITNINSSEHIRGAEHSRTQGQSNVNKQTHTNKEESITSSTNYTMQTRLGKALAVVLVKQRLKDLTRNILN